MNTKDMTKGNILYVLLGFALPMILSISFQQLYNIADSVIAGRFIGKEAFAAISTSYPITMIYLAIGTGSGVGCSIVIAQLFGMKDQSRLKTGIFTALISIFTLGIIALVIGNFINNWCIRVLNTPQEVFNDAATYLRIFVFSIPFLFVYNACNSIFQALGNSKTPLFFLIFSTIFNILLNLYFVIEMKMGVAGLAWATFIAQGIACLLSLLVLLKSIHRIQATDYQWFSLTLLKYITTYAIPSIIQSSVISIGQLFVQNLVNGYGTDVIAGYGAALKINYFVVHMMNAMGNAMSNFTGQNLGAKAYSRISKGYKTGISIITALLVIPFLFLIFLPDLLIQLFVDGGENIEEAVKIGSQFLYIVAPFHFLVGIKIVTDGVLRGTGNINCYMISTSSDLVVRVLFSFVLTTLLSSYLGIFYAFPIGWVIGTAVSLGYYFRSTWRMKGDPLKDIE